ncbi:MAG: PEP-CTERM sorting domain-containing protein [Pirellulales bacterium]|nr:PEP-CTERM sorting domain-containing protein [Pirellulales bacterium]
MFQRMSVSPLLAMIVAGLASTAGAVVITTVETDIAPSGGSGPYTPIFTNSAPFNSTGPSAIDILNGKTPIASSGNFALELSTGLSALTNGSVTTSYGDGTASSVHTAYATAGNGSGSGTTVTYSLGGAFNLTSIVIYGGWNDGGRDQQHYDVLVSSDGGANFTTLGSIDVNPGIQNTHTTPISTRVAFTDDVAVNVATSVTTLRINFLGVENGYTGYTEIDVFGTALTVPGDADRNGIVDMNDFILISNNFLTTQSVAGLNGDVNFDGVVDQLDFREWRVATGAGSTPTSTSVPEPAAIALAGLGVSLAMARRLRRQRS